MKKPTLWIQISGIVLFILILLVVIGEFVIPKPQKISYKTFEEMVEQKVVQSIMIEKETESLYITDKEHQIYVTQNPNYEGFKKELLEAGIDVSIKKSSKWSSVLSSILSILMYLGLFYILFYTMSGGRFKKIETPVSIPKTKFKDVAGYTEQKEDLITYVEYLKNPKQFKKRGAYMPKGVLLYGPPGTGKTLLARAIAGEAGVPFFSVGGSDFVEMYVGLGSKRVRSLFEKAREKAPCIIFIDEIDAVGGKRSVFGTAEHTQTLDALLKEMDGFEKDSGILVLATTNHPEQLDPALIRSGRFDSHIAIPLPSNKEERRQIMEVHRKGRKFASDVNFDVLAKQWVGFSGADIESVMNEASIIAVKRNLEVITKECLDEAFYKKVLKGHVKKNGQSERDDDELRLVAFHEAGHAITRKLLGNGEVSKVTILATTNGAGGVTFNVPKKMGLFTLEELENEVKVLYGGRAAEYLLFNKDSKKVTTGAQNDIERATEFIKKMVMEWGLQSEPVLLNFHQLPNQKDYTFEEMKTLSKRLFQETVQLLEKHYPLLEMVAQKLLENETLEAEELDVIMAEYQLKTSAISA